jgi:tetratricopeptide (TPR) repeat protein
MLAFQRRISVTSSFREIFAAVGFALALLAPMHVEAQQNYDNPREMYMLPEYCKYTQDFRTHVPGGNDRAEIERWTTLMGATFNHLHHYCWALMKTNRAAFLSPTRQDRRYNLAASLTDFDYVIQRAPPDFGLLPEILTRKGENLIQLERVGEGTAELKRAIEIKADYWRAYAAMSDYYKEAGQLAKAREWLEKGLSVAPDTKALMRRLTQLDAAQGKRKNDLQPPVGR